MAANQDKFNEMLEDTRLTSSRRSLIVVSLVLIAMNISEAELSKVNGLIFELTFKSPENLAILLVFATAFLLLRYYNHAAKYHELTRRRWTKNVMNEYIVYSDCEESQDASGFAYDLAPNKSYIDECADPDRPRGMVEIKLEAGCFLNASFVVNSHNSCKK
ncbi:hypothetical protein [Pseudidiomarina aestuarii]|uniref:hypothetical protein n=1 Tax=Pseudidiomarina aestuarii TaxID=624146 RepID=UPI003A9877EC